MLVNRLSLNSRNSSKPLSTDRFNKGDNANNGDDILPITSYKQGRKIYPNEVFLQRWSGGIFYHSSGEHMGMLLFIDRACAGS